jgi:hypothetical protein
MFKLAIISHPTVIAWEDIMKWIAIVGPFTTRSHETVRSRSSPWLWRKKSEGWTGNALVTVQMLGGQNEMDILQFATQTFLDQSYTIHLVAIIWFHHLQTCTSEEMSRGDHQYAFMRFDRCNWVQLVIVRFNLRMIIDAKRQGGKNARGDCESNSLTTFRSRPWIMSAILCWIKVVTEVAECDTEWIQSRQWTEYPQRATKVSRESQSCDDQITSRLNARIWSTVRH